MTDENRASRTQTKAIRHQASVEAANTLVGLMKSYPFLERLAEGGLMALQAVCGACLAYGVASAMQTRQPFWAAITAIAVTQHRYSDTRNLSRDQFIGAIAGGLFGFIGSWLGAGAHEIVGYAATIAAVVLFCWCMNVGSAARLGAITATIVLLVPIDGPLWDVPLLRVLQVIIGAMSTLVVSGCFSRISRRLRRT